MQEVAVQSWVLEKLADIRQMDEAITSWINDRCYDRVTDVQKTVTRVEYHDVRDVVENPNLPENTRVLSMVRTVTLYLDSDTNT